MSTFLPDLYLPEGSFSDVRLVIRPGGGEETIRFLRLLTSHQNQKVGSASLQLVEVFNLSNLEEENAPGS